MPDLRGEPGETHKAALGLEKWLQSVEVPDKLMDEGFGEGDTARMVALAETTPSLGLLLSVAPVPDA